jgi:hypothetical protein
MVLTSDFDIEFSFLNHLSEEYLMTLGTILHHEQITDDQFDLVVRQNHAHQKLKLEDLYKQGFLGRNGTGYQIHPFIYKPLVQILKMRHILT